MYLCKDLQQVAEKRIIFWVKKMQAYPALGCLYQGPWIVDVIIVGSRRMQTLNRTWRNKDQPTDVLSFPSAFGILGSLAICNTVLVRQAKHHTVRQELDVLLVHGILHLLGFDHELGFKEARVMRGWEQKLVGEGLIGRFVE